MVSYLLTEGEEWYGQERFLDVSNFLLLVLIIKLV